MNTGLNQAEAAVVLRDVSCELGGKAILDRVSLELRSGETTVVLGPSGAGKSTLLRTLAGFEPISEGDITLGGKIVSNAGSTVPPEKRNIGIVVQNYALFPHLTARQNVMFGIEAADRIAIADRWLARVDLGNRGDSYPHELSGGEQQRVALARALAREPGIVLLDEAFSSLDQQLRQVLRSQTKHLLRDTSAAVLVVTHDPDEAMELADRIIVLHEGKVLQQGYPQHLFWKPENLTVARLLGEVNEIRGECRGGVVTTRFGEVPAVGLTDGTAATVLARPAALRFIEDPGGDAKIVATQFQQGQTKLQLAAATGETVWAFAGGADHLGLGTRGRLEFLPDRFSVVLG